MSQFRLLSIEDDGKVADLICRVAEEVGFTTRTAFGDGVEKVCREFEADVIVLDIMMPDMDGIEVLQYLREQCCRAHIIILSGSDGLSRRIVEKMGNSLGFTIVANMTKPFRVAALRNLFEETKQKVIAGRSEPLSQGVG
jgi:DNA-binding response OmpR family regulator